MTNPEIGGFEPKPEIFLAIGKDAIVTINGQKEKGPERFYQEAGKAIRDHSVHLISIQERANASLEGLNSHSFANGFHTAFAYFSEQASSSGVLLPEVSESFADTFILDLNRNLDQSESDPLQRSRRHIIVKVNELAFSDRDFHLATSNVETEIDPLAYSAGATTAASAIREAQRIEALERLFDAPSPTRIY